jgi:hypothetical protein
MTPFGASGLIPHSSRRRKCCTKPATLAVGAGGSRNMSYRALSAQSVIDFDAIAFANQVA